MKKLMIVLWAASFLLIGCRRTKSLSSAPLGTELGALDESLAAEIQSLIEEGGAPSMAVSVVAGDELIWAKGYGEQPDLSTVYMAGSIDKAFTATAILQLYEQGLIDLNDDINQYLPYTVRHPDYPDTPITVRMLLAHQSGLPHDLPGSRYTDNDRPMLRWLFWNRGFQFQDLYHSLFPLDQEEQLEEVFSADSKYGFDFWVSKPGAGYQYSNSGFHLLSRYLIEKATGQQYAEYIRQNIFEPLKMNSSSFEAADFAETQLAIPYENFTAQGFSDLPLTSMAASGRLRTTVPDLSRFLMAQMNQGELEGARILEPETVALMQARSVPLSGEDFPGLELFGMGLGWQLWRDGLQGHTGATPGNYAQIIFGENEAGAYGAVLMMTNGCSQTECDFNWFDVYFVNIRELLLAGAEKIAEDGT